MKVGARAWSWGSLAASCRSPHPCPSSDQEAAIWKVTNNSNTQTWEGPPFVLGPEGIASPNWRQRRGCGPWDLSLSGEHDIPVDDDGNSVADSGNRNRKGKHPREMSHFPKQGWAGTAQSVSVMIQMLTRSVPPA